jgi:hypothetical protein
MRPPPPPGTTRCYCGQYAGCPHYTRICRMQGVVAMDNYRDYDNVNWITTPEGEFEEYDTRDDDAGPGQAETGEGAGDGAGQHLHSQGRDGDPHQHVSLV